MAKPARVSKYAINMVALQQICCFWVCLKWVSYRPVPTCDWSNDCSVGRRLLLCFAKAVVALVWGKHSYASLLFCMSSVRLGSAHSWVFSYLSPSCKTSRNSYSFCSSAAIPLLYINFRIFMLPENSVASEFFLLRLLILDCFLLKNFLVAITERYHAWVVLCPPQGSVFFHD